LLLTALEKGSAPINCLFDGVRISCSTGSSRENKKGNRDPCKAPARTHDKPPERGSKRSSLNLRITGVCGNSQIESLYPRRFVTMAMAGRDSFTWPPRVGSVKKIAVIPTLLTLGNAVCGFAAIAAASKIGQNQTSADTEFYFALSGWLIIGRMVFDALDGYVARISKTSSGFGW